MSSNSPTTQILSSYNHQPSSVLQGVVSPYMMLHGENSMYIWGNFLSLIVVSLSMSFQMMILINMYTQCINDRQILHAQLLREYDIKFVFPRTSRWTLSRGVEAIPRATMTSGGEPCPGQISPPYRPSSSFPTELFTRIHKSVSPSTTPIQRRHKADMPMMHSNINNGTLEDSIDTKHRPVVVVKSPRSKKTTLMSTRVGDTIGWRSIHNGYNEEDEDGHKDRISNTNSMAETVSRRSPRFTHTR